MDIQPPHVAADPDRLRATAADYETAQKHDLAAVIRRVADEVERSLAAALPEPDRESSATSHVPSRPAGLRPVHNC